MEDKNKTVAKEAVKPKKEKKSNIVVEAFKSMWSKVCPIIEIVDKENKLKK